MKRVFFGAGVALGIDSFAIEPNWFEFKRIEIPIKNLDPKFDHYRIGLVADLHYPRFISQVQIHRAWSLLSGFRPDLIALPGDIVSQRHGIDDVPDFTGLLDNWQAPDGSFFTLGNHDHWVDARVIRSQMRWNTPFRGIEHKSVVITRGAAELAIGGVGDLWTGTVNIDDAFDDVAPLTPRILLCHNPDVAESSQSPTRVDLMLSGHTHGGQICLPGKGALAVPSAYGRKFTRGLVQGKRYRVYVTKGLCSVMGARFWCRPEVTGIVLRSATGS